MKMENYLNKNVGGEWRMKRFKLMFFFNSFLSVQTKRISIAISKCVCVWCLYILRWLLKFNRKINIYSRETILKSIFNTLTLYLFQILVKTTKRKLLRSNNPLACFIIVKKKCWRQRQRRRRRYEDWRRQNQRE